MSIMSFNTVDFIVLFAWIPFWWIMAGVSLKIMGSHDTQKEERRKQEQMEGGE